MKVIRLEKVYSNLVADMRDLQQKGPVLGGEKSYQRKMAKVGDMQIRVRRLLTYQEKLKSAGEPPHLTPKLDGVRLCVVRS